MAWVLDTCVVSELIRPAPDPNVTRWLAARLRDCLLPGVAIGEIQFGIERMPEGARRNQLQVWFDRLCLEFAQRVLPADEAVWRAWSRLRASCHAMGRPQSDLDLLIAAMAATHRLPLVTRNIRHFQDTGLQLVNPWAAAPAA